MLSILKATVGFYLNSHLENQDIHTGLTH